MQAKNKKCKRSIRIHTKNRRKSAKHAKYFGVAFLFAVLIALFDCICGCMYFGHFLVPRFFVCTFYSICILFHVLSSFLKLSKDLRFRPHFCLVLVIMDSATPCQMYLPAMKKLKASYHELLLQWPHVIQKTPHWMILVRPKGSVNSGMVLEQCHPPFEDATFCSRVPKGQLSIRGTK